MSGRPTASVDVPGRRPRTHRGSDLPSPAVHALTPLLAFTIQTKSASGPNLAFPCKG